MSCKCKLPEIQGNHPDQASKWETITSQCGTGWHFRHKGLLILCRYPFPCEFLCCSIPLQSIPIHVIYSKEIIKHSNVANIIILSLFCRKISAKELRHKGERKFVFRIDKCVIINCSVKISTPKYVFCKHVKKNNTYLFQVKYSAFVAVNTEHLYLL